MAARWGEALLSLCCSGHVCLVHAALKHPVTKDDCHRFRVGALPPPPHAARQKLAGSQSA